MTEVLGVPPVAYGGQGGLGDIVLSPDFASGDRAGGGTVYLSWAEPGRGDTRGAAVARAVLDRSGPQPRLRDLAVIWRQTPKTTGEGHYSHRIAFAPDGRLLFVASGERQKMAPAQDMAGNLGKIVRLLPDGAPAPGNPFAARGGVAAQVWTLGHRNILGPRPSIPTGGCGISSTGRAAATSSTWSSPAGTMAGRWCPKAGTTAGKAFPRMPRGPISPRPRCRGIR